MKPLGIKVKVALATSITSIVIIALVSALQIQRMKQDFTRVLFAQQNALIQHTAEELDGKLQMLLDIIAESARMQPPAIANDEAALRAYYGQRAMLTLFDDIIIVNRDGLVVADLPRMQGRAGRNVADRAYFQQVMAGRKPMIGDPVLGRTHGKPLIQVMAPVFDANGEIVCVLMGALQLYQNNMLGNLRTAKVGKTGFYYALTRGENPVYVLHPDPARMLQPRPPNANPSTSQALNENFEGTVISTGSSQLQALNSYKALQTVNWVLGASLPVDEAFAPFEGALYRLGAITLVAALGAAAVLSWLTLRLLAPVGRLRNAIMALRSTPSRFTPLPLSHQDEIGELTQAFNDLMHERLQADAHLEHERDRAEAANRAKSDFVANMSHEIRTPMNAVLGMVYLLGNTPLTPQQRKYLSMVKTAGHSLMGILNDVLDFSKIEARRMELAPVEFDLDEAMGTLATTMTMNASEKELELAVVVEPDVPKLLYGDALRLQQILVNLAGNAIKFTEQGEVVVSVRRSERQPQQEDQVSLRFDVRDTGIGISEERQAQLFTAFSQGDESITRRFGGTGLGLAITKSLIELMGGEIFLRSAPGSGSHFWFELTFYALSNRTEETRRPSIGPLRVLVADDNRTSREMVSRLITAWGWEADEVDCGEAAIRQYQAALQVPHPYDVVMADWHMPGMDGLAAAKAIRLQAGTRSQPIVVMVNAFARDQLEDISGTPEADVVLVKPITSSSLFEALHQAVVAKNGGDERSAQNGARNLLVGVHFLLVEDNLLNQAVARGILEHAGATLDVVGDGQQAVDVLRAESDNYDVVLMDMQMPVLDGFTATEIIRRELRLELPVIAMTAGVLASERDRCMRAGISDFIAKPVVVEEMMAVIARHLPERRRLPRAGDGSGAGGTVLAPASPLPLAAAVTSTVSTATALAAALPPAAPTEQAAAAAPADAASEQVFSMDSLMRVMGKDAKGRAVMFKMVRGALNGGMQPADDADKALSEGRAADAARIFHGLRGAVGTLGAKRLIRATLEAETAIGSGAEADLPAAFAAVRRELQRVLECGRSWLEREEAGGLAGAPSRGANAPSDSRATMGE
ncbi:response regulator [Pseudoduganella violacea]|uniref:Sensory/regulatory protein RpfC n=1 Tax=Pseudoduganella violacea TaxID=1715466 RepID=A0A7W5B688_9BURK|nr:response regulator [Pseudoduganella violacea]MBB3117329.1 signal transduction histidine kinase/DNA-binding response OmpR family regulator [Pseudoduganella violacea]